MSVEKHVESLHVKHQHLEDAIHEKMCQPAKDTDAINRLKIKKLHLKDEISKLEVSIEHK